jgi:hypothetical protein
MNKYRIVGDIDPNNGSYTEITAKVDTLFFSDDICLDWVDYKGNETIVGIIGKAQDYQITIDIDGDGWITKK